jgi:light-regulated signal transduction histidine kinase (bacteriophytochrome)
MLRRVRKASDHLAALIDAMLTLSRLTRREMRVERVNLGAVARSVADSLRAAEPQRQASILLPAELEARGDRELLRVVLENLLGNAWKFTSEQPQAQIEFGVTQVDGERAYFVRDDGAGFDMAYADKLFIPFQRLHRQEQFPGTGIGLATVERIVHRHGGRVWAEGAVNKGATFFFTL